METTIDEVVAKQKKLHESRVLRIKRLAAKALRPEALDGLVKDGTNQVDVLAIVLLILHVRWAAYLREELAKHGDSGCCIFDYSLGIYATKNARFPFTLLEEPRTVQGNVARDAAAQRIKVDVEHFFGTKSDVYIVGGAMD